MALLIPHAEFNYFLLFFTHKNKINFTFSTWD